MIGASIGYFIVTILVTIGITVWAARRNTGRASLYAAEGKVTGTQNGLAIAGDYLSAGTVLGVVGLYSFVGVDVSLYFIAPLAGLCFGLALVVGPLRRMGRFTLGDVLESRLQDSRIRIVPGICAVAISLINLVAQVVGAGALIGIVFGLSFNVSAAVVGALMTVYVVFGGMLAATWVQIIKAALLVAAMILMAALCMGHAGSLESLYAKAGEAQRTGQQLFAFGTMQMGWYSSISLAVASIAGIMSLPHLLIRFFTVPDEVQARRSLLVGTFLIGGTFSVIFLIIGPAGLAFVTGNEAFRDESGVIGGSNMITLHLARLLGGEFLFGLMSAVTFATILAVVAGLTVSISSAVSHDIIGSLSGERSLSERVEIRLFRLAAVLTSVFAVGLAILFQHENLTFLIVMGLNVAAGSTFPLLILAIYWKGFTARGAIAAGSVGLISSIGLIILGPACWVKALGFAEPIFPSDYPALISLPLALAAAWLFRGRRTTEPAAVTS